MGIFSLFRNTKTSLQESGVLSGLCDIHTHILPGVDDGVKTMEQSLEILAYMESLGVNELWCTPHVMDDIPNQTDDLKTRFAQLQEAYKGPIKLNLAAEYMLDSEFENRLEKDDLLKLPGDIVLVETSSNVPPYNLLDMIEKILSKGYRPMMAHPERNRYMQKADYRHLHQLGVYFQLNLGSTIGYYGETAQKKSWNLLADGLYKAAGSDCHRLISVQDQYNRAVLPKEVIADIQKLLETSKQ